MHESIPSLESTLYLLLPLLGEDKCFNKKKQ